jgi:hypothetical protein
MDTAAIVSRNTPDPPAKPVGRPVGSSGAPYTPHKLRLKTLNQLDGRTFASRRARELIAAIENDLGGSDAMTEGLRQLVQRAAVLGALIESNEAAWLAGDAVDLNTYFQAINSQRRILSTLGLERRTRDVTPPLAQYLAERSAAVVEDPVEVEEPPS